MFAVPWSLDARHGAALAVALACPVLVYHAYRLLCAGPSVTGYGEEILPPRLPGLAISSVRPFYTRRFDFFRLGFRSVKSSTFRFSLLGHTVIAVSGAEGRKAVLSAQALDLNEGFKVLSGAIPVVAGITSDLPTKTLQLIHKRLGGVQTHARLSQLIPSLLKDCRRTLGSLPSTGSFDPFEYLHEVIFQLTVRALSCAELADDPAAVARLHGLYDALDRGNTPAAILVPISPTALLNTWRSKTVHDIILAAVRKRQADVAAGEKAPQDTLQMLLDEGTAPSLIVGFMMGLMVAGSRSTGTTTSWLIVFLGNHPSWRSKIVSELSDLLAHGTSDSSRLTERLGSVSLEDWESRTPMLDAAIRETLRLAQPHVAMRKNVSTADIPLPGGQVIPPGAFAVYPFADVHLDESLYPNPWAWNPARLEPSGQAMAYIGWGGGKTVCAGQRLARVMLKMLTATFLLSFDYEIMNESGQPATPLPNWNDTLTCKPEEACFLRYARRPDTEL